LPCHPLVHGTHFGENRLVSDNVNSPQSDHAHRMSCLRCDLSEILEQTRLPDPELIDLIEQAFLDGQKANLAYLQLAQMGVYCEGGFN